ncbi:MAG: hypothetical protein ABJF01_14565 [bacterium]
MIPFDRSSRAVAANDEGNRVDFDEATANCIAVIGVLHENEHSWIVLHGATPV